MSYVNCYIVTQSYIGILGTPHSRSEIWKHL